MRPSDGEEVRVREVGIGGHVFDAVCDADGKIFVEGEGDLVTVVCVDLYGWRRTIARTKDVEMRHERIDWTRLLETPRRLRLKT